MNTMQIVVIAAAAAAVLVLLLVALVVSRRRRRAAQERAAAPFEGSFLDQAPQDTLGDLGRAERGAEVTPAAPSAESPAASDAEPATGGSGLDWSPATSSEPPLRAGRPASEEATPSAMPAPPDSRAVADPEPPSPPATEPPAEDGVEEVPPHPSPTALAVSAAAEMPAAAKAPAPESPAAMATPEAEGHMVPLSDIIVTTSNKMVNLDDAEVRRMLTDLVTYEIDQAAEYRRRGQLVDAVLQLTEAEKVTRALGMDESVQRIRAMLREIQKRS